MPVALTEDDLQAADRTEAPRKRWTRAEVEVLESLDSFADQKWELVEGELVNKMGKKRRHTIVASRLHRLLTLAFGWERVQSEAPIEVATADRPVNLPEPDLIVLRRDLDRIQTTPTPSELHLVVEVSDSSLGQDLRTKAALYARAGVAEYWVADIQSSRLIVHRQPEPTGVYRDVQVYLQGESIAPRAAPEHPVAISEVFA